MNDVPSKSLPSLKLYLLGFVLLTGVAAGFTLLLLGERRLSEFEDAVLVQIGERRTEAAGKLFARALWTDWRDVSTLAAQQNGDLAALRPELDLIVGDGERISWAGVARVDGTVVAGSGGLLVGASAAQRPWFQNGLEGPFAADVHQAVLLADLLPKVDGETARFLDLSAPIKAADGHVIGVVGFHINYTWAQAFLAETAGIVGVETAIINRAGDVVVGPKELVGRHFDAAILGAARIGSRTARMADWPDGSESLTIVVPTVGYRDLPSFGWSLVGRINSEALAPARQGFTDAILAQICALALVLLSATVMFIRFFIRPMSQLAEDAERIASGEPIYPIESRRTAELAHLSEAIVRLQTVRDRRLAG